MTDPDPTNCQPEWLTEGSCDEPFYKEHSGKRYCVLHYPSTDKQEEFNRAVEIRFDESSSKYLDFVGVWFPDLVSFLGKRFANPVDFSYARFNSDVEFTESHFKKARFVGAHFKAEANFEATQYEGIGDFSHASFDGPVSFTRAIFCGDGKFVQTRFASIAAFSGVEFEQDSNFMSATFHVVAYFGVDRFPLVDGKIETHRARFKDVNFSDAFFTRCTFSQAAFSGSAKFLYTTVDQEIDFSTTDFRKCDFSNSRLSNANFDGSFFLEAPKFNGCQFQGNTVFATTRLPGIDLSDATFNGPVDFSLARFEKTVEEWEKNRLKECNIESGPSAAVQRIIICFDKATFKEGFTWKAIHLYQEKGLLRFDESLFEKPERVRFISTSLPPHSFIGVDPRKFHFIDARFGHIDKRTALSEAKQALKKHERSYSEPMLELAYRQLAVNAEENNRYEQAADLRYLAMEVARSMRWRRVDWFRLSWWYWLLSGYGEKVRRAFTALLMIWLLFAAIYWGANSTWWQPLKVTGVASSHNDQVSPPTALAFPEALLYSANVMALQKPEPLPANKRAKLFVLIEAVLGPVQLALLALAIRRKFMR